MKTLIITIIILAITVLYLARQKYLLKETTRQGWAIVGGKYHHIFVNNFDIEDAKVGDKVREYYIDGQLVKTDVVLKIFD